MSFRLRPRLEDMVARVGVGVGWREGDGMARTMARTAGRTAAERAASFMAAVSKDWK